MKLTKTFLGLFLALGLLGACGDDGGGTPADTGPDAPPPDASPACAEATQHSDFKWISENVFSKSCANFASCHGDIGTQESLNLTATKAYEELVNVASVQVPGKKLVAPGSCENSYLFDKLTNNTNVMPTDKKSMPLNNPLLCKEKRDAVCRWIAAGAPND
jgi:hypothetical protein